jgi:hypothetical protein
MSLPSTVLGVTAKQLLVLVTVGCLAAYLLSNHDETSARPRHRGVHPFPGAGGRAGGHGGEHDAGQAGGGIPAYNSPGYKRLIYAVEGERGG